MIKRFKAKTQIEFLNVCKLELETKGFSEQDIETICYMLEDAFVQGIKLEQEIVKTCKAYLEK